MPDIVISPNHHTRLKFSVPISRTIYFSARSSIPVQTFILDTTGMNNFSIGQAFNFFGGFTDNRTFHEQQLVLPFEGEWFLVIVNRNMAQSALIHYEVRL
jgi:hypothetical protein